VVPISERHTFIQAILAAPDDDLPRLIYADWLDEHGESDRSEFIRVQIERARLETDGSSSQAVFAFLQKSPCYTALKMDWESIDAGVARRIALREREEALRKRYKRAWKDTEVPRHGGMLRTGWELERGFFAKGTVRNALDLVISARGLSRYVPLRHLELSFFPAAQAVLLNESGLLARLDTLTVAGARGSVVRALGEFPDTAHIRNLRCRACDMDAVARALAESPKWRGLRTLDLNCQDALSASAAEELFRAEHLRSLTRLRLFGDRWRARTIRPLAEGKFSALRELVLFQCDLDDEAAEALADSPSLKNLCTLELESSRITGAGASALLSSRHLRQLAVLNLKQNPVRGLNSALLAGARNRSLRALHLGYGPKSAGDIKALAACPALRGLIWLELSNNAANDRAIQALTEAKGWTDLAMLHLTNNLIGDKGAASLASWSGLAKVRHLHLYVNKFGPEGARALAASPYLDELRHLCVDPEATGAEGVKLLQKRFGRTAISHRAGGVW
jgi:uncharacterized protein (TIGR02996 family)